MRILCNLAGCREDELVPFCHRCNAHIYDGDFLQDGLLSPVLRRIRGLLAWRPWKRCEVCGRPYVRGYDEYCCSPKCFDEWIPF